jgi:hypothetical protein
LAFTKSFAMAIAAALAITRDPAVRLREIQDQVPRTLPEAERASGKAGHADHSAARAHIIYAATSPGR